MQDDLSLGEKRHEKRFLIRQDDKHSLVCPSLPSCPTHALLLAATHPDFLRQYSVFAFILPHPDQLLELSLFACSQFGVRPEDAAESQEEKSV
jgi:hypothetical protein